MKKAWSLQSGIHHAFLFCDQAKRRDHTDDHRRDLWSRCDHKIFLLGLLWFQRLVSALVTSCCSFPCVQVFSVFFLVICPVFVLVFFHPVFVYWHVCSFLVLSSLYYFHFWLLCSSLSTWHYHLYFCPVYTGVKKVSKLVKRELSFFWISFH